MTDGLDLGELPEGLRPRRTSRLAGTVAVLVSTALVMLIYAAASAVWPGSAVAWAAIGWLVVAAAHLRAFGPPWRGPP